MHAWHLQVTSWACGAQQKAKRVNECGNEAAKNVTGGVKLSRPPLSPVRVLLSAHMKCERWKFSLFSLLLASEGKAEVLGGSSWSWVPCIMIGFILNSNTCEDFASLRWTEWESVSAVRCRTNWARLSLHRAHWKIYQLQSARRNVLDIGESNVVVLHQKSIELPEISPLQSHHI